jgi:hypothetical protein
MSEYQHVECLIAAEKNISLAQRDLFEYMYVNKNDVRASEIHNELKNLSNRISTLIKDRPIKKVVGYGFCPQCGAKGVSRERRINGNDKCENGHSYPSREAKH